MRGMKLVICFLFFVWFSGCAPWPRETTNEDPRTRGESQFDPLGFPQDQVIVTEGEPGGNKEKATEYDKDNKTKLREPEKERSTSPRKVYRVQFFATQYPDQATEVAESVRNQLAENVYIDYKVPYYWVRVGDCETKEEAESLLEKIRELGYEESWVVEAKVER